MNARRWASRSLSVPLSCGSSRALSSTVTGTFRFRSILTVTRSLAEVSISSQAPRFGISLAPNSRRPVAGSSTEVKYTPGERTSWETTTRSVPFTMNVPSPVIMAKSPM